MKKNTASNHQEQVKDLFVIPQISILVPDRWSVYIDIYSTLAYFLEEYSHT